MLYLSLCIVFVPLCGSMPLAGWVQSPGYPSGYEPFSSLTWARCAPPGHTLSLALTHLDLEDSYQCENDALKVYVDGNLISTLCGSISLQDLHSSVNPSLVSLPGGCLNVSFSANSSNMERHSGFKVFYTIQDYNECDGKDMKCSHFCYNFVGGYLCACPLGYLLDADNHNCSVIDCGDPTDLLNGNITFISEVKKKQFLSVIEYRCNEPYYSFDKNDKAVQLTCEADHKWKQASNEGPPVCVPVCGRPKHSFRSSQRVFQGKVAKRGQFPWQVLKMGGGRGGAFVIAPQWILTAAHTLAGVDKQMIKLYVGSNVVEELLKTSPLEVASVHVHPHYIGSSNGNEDFDNDIALIKLVNPITFGEDVMPLCLPRPDSQYPKDKLGTVSGFGVTEEHKMPKELRYVELPLVDQALCHASIDALRSASPEISNFTENMFCAGFQGGSKDTCTGDSGSAYVLKEGDYYWAAGIVSWGIGCGNEGVYGVYTRVAQYLDWLTKTMEENAQSVVDCGMPTLPYKVIVENLESTHYKSEIHFRCSSKYYQLESDEVFTCEADGLWTSKTGQTKIPRCLPICGLTDNLIGSTGRILGGQRAKDGQIPWQLLIKSPEKGGASLINDRWAVTAAQVVDKYQSDTITVYGGMIDGRDQNAKVMQTEKIIVHPDYGKDGGTDALFNNDIALLKLSSRVELGPKLLPICLPESSEGAALQGKLGTVSGYGTTDKRDVARFLQYVNIEEHQTGKCRDTPNDERGNSPIFTDNMFCAGAGTEGGDSCRGDAGGPLFVPMLGFGRSGDPYRLKGIVSWGPNCLDKGFKGYYTKVQNYLGWIKETIEKDEQKGGQ